MSSTITWYSSWSASTGCISTFTCRGCSIQPGWSPTCTASWGCRSPRPHRWGRSATRSVPACTASPATSTCRGWTSRRVNARTTCCTNTWRGSPARRGCCSSGGPRRRPTCSVPRSAATPTADAYRGSWPPPAWSTTSTSTPSTPTSGRSSSSSAPTSPTRRRCASTATNGPNDRPPTGIAHTALDGDRHLRRPSRGADDLRPARAGPGPALLDKWLRSYRHVRRHRSVGGLPVWLSIWRRPSSP